MQTGVVAGRLAVVALACCACMTSGLAAESGDPVTRWTLIADEYGHGSANWRTLAIMHRAMHDALNAAHPVYARWAPLTADEPAADGALPEVAMTASAYQVLLLLHPDRHDDTEQAVKSALSSFADGPDKQAGVRLGTAIGTAAVRRRSDDGSTSAREFVGSNQPGHWRPTPVLHMTSSTNDTRPFLFAATSDVPSVPPPALGSAVYEQQRAETRRLGGASSTDRTGQQTEHALFWAYQSSQRGYVYLGVKLLEAHPRPGGVYEEARVMSQLTSALADSAILVWGEKEKFYFWRPVTAIRAAEGETSAVDAWRPLIETPPFPEYPSGHAADCFTGAGILKMAFPDLREPIVYTALPSVPSPGSMAVEGQVPEGSDWIDPRAQPRRQTFPSLTAAAEDCALSRIWAGAHFRAADDEAKRLADIIVQRAAASVPPVN